MNIDFAALHPHEPPRRRHPARTPLIIAAVIIGLAIVIGAPVALAGTRMITEGEDGRAALVSAQEAATRFDLAAATDAVRVAKAHFQNADRLGYALTPLYVVPFLSGPAREARTVTRSALRTAEALETIVTVGDQAFGVLAGAGGFVANAPTLRGAEIAFFRLSPTDRRALLSGIDDARPKLRDALAQLDEAITGFKSIPQNGILGSTNVAFAPIIERMESLRATVSDTTSLLDLLPALAGYPAPRTYLLLLQNNTELRPTGGFIGTIGTVTIADGSAIDFKTEDVYVVDGHITSRVTDPAPAPLKKYLGVDKWFLRDANWSPDFPTAARKAAELYALEGSDARHIDGVVAVDPTVAANLLRVVGAVRIGSSTFTPDNVTDELEFQVEKGFDAKGVPFTQRKDILVALADEVFRRAVALPNDGWQQAVDVFTNALTEKHVLIAPFDDALAKVARNRNWDGALVPPATGDFLMVVDANLAALKTDSVVDRSVRYAIEPQVPCGPPSPADCGGYLATVTVRYTNHGSFSWKTTRYRDYVRVVAPAGSRLERVDGSMANDKILCPACGPGTVDTVNEAGLQTFGTFLSVEPGETKELSFTYRLPDSVTAQVAAGTYSLSVQKQPGLIAVPLTLDLDFGKKLTNAAPPEDPKDFGDTRYRISSDLKTDREFNVSF